MAGFKVRKNWPLGKAKDRPLPKTGQEVMTEFIGGDPERGSVFRGATREARDENKMLREKVAALQQRLVEPMPATNIFKTRDELKKQMASAERYEKGGVVRHDNKGYRRI